MRNLFGSIAAWVLVVGVGCLACASTFGQTDDFPQKLETGCNDETACRRLLVEAEARVARCKPNTIGYVRCSDARADVRIARLLLQEQIDRRNADEKARLEKARKEREAMQEEQRQAARLARQQQLAAEEDEREHRRREQQQRGKQAKASCRAEAGRIRRLAATPEYAIAVSSAAICNEQRLIRESQAELAREKRITARSGVADLTVRRDLVESMEASEADIRSLKAALRKNHGAAPRPCRSVERIWSCVEISRCQLQQDMMGGGCLASEKCDADVRDYASVWLMAADVVEEPGRAKDEEKLDRICKLAS